MSNSGLYLITNKITGDYYGGSSVDIDRRWKEHKRSVKSTKLSCPKLHSDMRVYGVDAFDFKILLICSVSDLSMYEQLWLNYNVGLLNCYNIATDSTCEFRGIKLTENHKSKISKALMGHQVSDETRLKISRSNTGKKRSAEVIDARRKLLIGKKPHKNSILGTIQFNKTRIWSDESRKKLSDARKLWHHKNKQQRLDNE